MLRDPPLRDWFDDAINRDNRPRHWQVAAGMTAAIAPMPNRISVPDKPPWMIRLWRRLSRLIRPAPKHVLVGRSLILTDEAIEAMRQHERRANVSEPVPPND